MGGAERVASELANYWSKKDYRVHLILLVESDHFYDISDKVIIHQLKFTSKYSLFRNFKQLKILIQLRGIFKKGDIRFVLSFMTKYNVLTILASLFLNVNVYVSDRSNPKKKLPFYLSVLRKIFYPFAKGIVAQTQLAKEILVRQTNNSNIKVIPNPIRNVEFINNIEKDKIILNIGRLVPEKGQNDLIDIFYKSNLPEWKLVILGDGILRKELENKILDLSLEDRVFILGEVQDVDNWIAKSSIFAFTSFSEGFPNALAEAIVGGIPSISFDCDAGPRDIIIDNVNGFLIPKWDRSLYISRLKKLAENEDCRRRLSNNTIIRERLTMDRISDEILKFCDVQN